MVGNQIRANPKVARMVHDAGHEIGLHSDNHASLDKLSATDAANNMARNLKAIQNAVPNVRLGYWRTPYGAISKANAIASIQKVIPTLSHAAWTVDTLDWFKGRTYASFRETINAPLKRHNVVLMHDHTGPTQSWLNDAIT